MLRPSSFRVPTIPSSKSVDCWFYRVVHVFFACILYVMVGLMFSSKGLDQSSVVIDLSRGPVLGCFWQFKVLMPCVWGLWPWQLFMSLP